VIAWNTVYLAAVIDQPRGEGQMVNAEDLARRSPARYELISPYGKYAFDVSEDFGGAGLRPLWSGRSPA
jgi:hypothetical protein